MKYDKKLGGQYKKCERCKTLKVCWQHHLSHRRYSDEVIWVCHNCHQEIHSEPFKAYSEGFLIKHNTSYQITMKNVKQRGCSHSRSYFNSSLGYIKCQFCGKKVETVNFGTKKKTQTPNTTKQPTIKMGKEIQDPRIKLAEYFNAKLRKLEIEIKKSKSDKEKLAALTQQKRDLKVKMLELQRTFDN